MQGNSMKSFKQFSLMTLWVLVFMLIYQGQIEARPYYHQAPVRVYPAYPPPAYYPNAYYPGYHPQPNVIVVQPQGVWPASNNNLYRYDNIYGPEASAAGRMGHQVVNPAPRLYFH